ncbi:MAG: aldehyde dehydrogenase family protein [Acidobacteria bacterium]|nr:aldehyde dehydrogenase family protein [Acidobacteriota bacterium]
MAKAYERIQPGRQVFLNYIGGEWVESVSGRTFENRSPADRDDVLGVFQSSNAEDVNRAVEAAREAFRTWRLVPAPRRAEILFRAAQLLVERKEAFARDMTREMGKILKESRGDVQEAIDISFYAAGEGRRMFGHTTPAELPDKFALSVRMPLGVCALITPWNFPMAIPSWKLLPALVCGNTVVLKPATDTPLSVYNLVRTFEEAGVPKGVINLVTGGGREVGEALLGHPGTSLVSFTGSCEVGKHIASVCAPLYKKHSLEMGGKNVIMVMDDANVDLAVDGAVWGGFGTTGQRCTAASRVVVHRKVLREFTDRFVARARGLKVGTGQDESVEMGPLINESQRDSVLGYIEIGQREGARLLTGGHRLDKGEYARGWYLEPTVFGDVDPGMRIAQEEIFGPVVAVIPCDSLEHAIEIGNGVVYGLSSAIYTQDINKAFVAMRDMYTGIFYVNASTIGAEVHLPFGGTKDTGNGHREAGQAMLDVFSEWKAVYVDYSGKLQRAQIDLPRT